jgi:hypothetical protein
MNFIMSFYWRYFHHKWPHWMARRIVLTSNVCIMEGNGQVSYDFLTIGLKGSWMVPLTQKEVNPFLSKCFPILLMPNYQNR